MHPLAEALNRDIESQSPDAFALLSARGRALYFPKGILTQTAEAREKAHRFNATIGEATEGDGPMALPAVLSHLGDVEPAAALRYAPAAGKPELRKAWRAKQQAENPLLRSCELGLPIVTSAITHGLALVGDLFVDPGDSILLPDKLWGNYRMTYEVRLGAKITTFETYDESSGRFNVSALRAALGQAPRKVILLLNFPNNPTGYMPGREEVEGMRDAILAAAEGGQRLLVICDDAYFGLVYDEHGLSESPFGYFANLHPRVLGIKLDAATKELFVWGLRCGFMTYAPPPCSSPDIVLAALEKKTMGAIRGGISSSPHLSQSLVLAALSSPQIGEERRQKFEILKGRAERVKEVAYRERYRGSWDVYPFNAGYFMCIRVKDVDAEALRLHLLSQHGVGVISLGKTDIRVAFSCLGEAEVEPLFECIHQAIGELLA